MPYDTQKPLTNGSDDPEIKQLEDEVTALLQEINSEREKHMAETQSSVNEIENTPDLPDEDSQDKADEEELQKTQEELDDGLDEAMLDLSTKQGEDVEL